MKVGDAYNPKRLFRGIFIPESVARMPRENLSPGAKMAFGWLSWHTDDNTGECCPSADTLALELGVSERQAREYLAQLERQGFIRQSRRGPESNSFEFCWHEVLESCVRKDRKKTSDQRPEENPVKSGTELPVSLRDKEVYRNTTEETPIVPLLQTQDLDLEDDIRTFAPNACRRAGRPRLKLGRQSDRHMLEKLEEGEEKHGKVFFRQCLVGYYATSSQWLKDAGWTLYRFLQNPEEYAPKAEALQEPISLPPPTIEPLVPTVARIDYPARWNELVPARPVTWDSTRGDANSLRNCESDPIFRERFDEMCRNAQRLHQERGKAVEWITFEFAIRTNGKGKGWWRILEEMKPSAPAKVQKKSLADIMGMGKKETKNVHSGV